MCTTETVMSGYTGISSLTPDESTSDHSWNIDQNLSIYISYVADEYASEEYFKKVFKSLNIGTIKRVDFQPKYSVYSGGSVGKIAFIHMESWAENTSVKNLQEKIKDETGDKEARIVHDDPQYWVLRRNKRPIPDNYTGQMSNLQSSMFEMNRSMSNRIHELETTIGHMQWWIRVHDANIRYLCDRFNPDAIIQATAVSQPSTYVPVTPVHTNVDMFDEGWAKRLRTRKRQVNYDENSNCDDAGWP